MLLRRKLYSLACMGGGVPALRATCFAGAPTAVEPAAMDMSTTEPEPILAPSPIAMFPRIDACAPTYTEGHASHATHK